MSRDEGRERRSTPLLKEDLAAHTCTVGQRLALLGGVPFFRGLSGEQIEEINACFRNRSFAAGDLLYAAGDPAQQLYVLLAGKVKLVRHSLGGQDVLLDLLAPGDFFGTLSALGEDEYPDSALAQTDCCAISVGSAHFQDIMQRYPQVALAGLHIVQARLHSAHDVIRQLSAESVESRIAARLLKLADRFGEDQGDRVLLQLPLSRQDLADMAGTTLESASRVISQFRKSGYIESGRQWLAILDRRGLEELAQGG